MKIFAEKSFEKTAGSKKTACDCTQAGLKYFHKARTRMRRSLQEILFSEQGRLIPLHRPIPRGGGG